MSAIDDVKQRLDIVDVVSGYVRLEKAGRNFKALCPFHQEKTPSFFVFPDRQSCRCFGCNAGGDVISFVMKREGVDFGEALRMLADRAGVSIARTREPTEDKVAGRVYQANEAAAQHYHQQLRTAPAAQGARDYVEKRGISERSVSDFLLGFSTGEGLKEHLVGQGFKESELLDAGLLREGESGKRELFRRRLLFPIRDIKGRVVGFGGRALDDSTPKYLNTPQTAVFDKSGVLYGIDRARGAIRERGLAVVVEGYTDVITAHQYGENNVVASMGTALTEKQVKLLKGLTKRLAFALDPDAAGDAATLRGIEVARRALERERLEMPTLLGTTSRLKAQMRIISLPQGKDPDEVIREDPQSWKQLVDEGLPLVEHVIRVVASRLDLTRPEGKSSAIEQLLPLVAELEDETEREFYLGKLAALLGVRDKVLLDKAADLRRTRGEKARPALARPTSVARSGDPWEEYCLALLLQHPELRVAAGALATEHFERSENREVFTAWREAADPGELAEVVGTDLRGHLETLSNRALPPASQAEWEKALQDCVRRLEGRRLKIQEEVITSEGVSTFADGEEVGSERLAILQQEPVDVNAQLVKTMQEISGCDRSNRDDR